MIRLLLIAFALVGCAQAASRPKSGAVKVLFFGDSITAGQGVTPAERWTSLVAARSHGAFTELNEGKGGRPTSAIDEFSAAVEKYREDPAVAVLVIALGANDARDTSPDCVAQATGNLAKMIAIARERAPRWRIAVCTPYNINLAALGPTHAIGPLRERNLIGMRQAFQVLALKERCSVIDLYGVIPPASQTHDGVHPDPAGHAAIATLAQPILEAIVAEAR